MFTWICPQCGREVPPAYTECPNCNPKNAPAAEVPVGAAVTPEVPLQEPQQGMLAASAGPPVGVAPPPQPPPYAAPPVNVPPAYYPPPHPPSGGMPTWLMAIVFSMAFVGLGAAVYWGIDYLRSRPVSKPTAVVESPSAKPGTATNAYQKYIEISGMRFVEDPKHKGKIMVKFLVTNHSPAEIAGLKGNVTVWGSTSRSEEDAQGTFTFDTDVKSYDSKELTEPLTTKKEIYELADWQNITTDLQITAPSDSTTQ
jgi:hypothetical protein